MDGPMEYGFLMLPVSISVNLLLVTSGLSFKKKYSNSVGLLIINSIGLIWAAFWLWINLTIPQMD